MPRRKGGRISVPTPGGDHRNEMESSQWQPILSELGSETLGTVTETRDAMATASLEIAGALRVLAVRLEPLRGIATQIRRLAEVFGRLELEARSDRPMPDVAPLASAFFTAAIEIGEVGDLAALLASNFRLASTIEAKLTHASGLASEALRVAVRL